MLFFFAVWRKFTSSLIHERCQSWNGVIMALAVIPVIPLEYWYRCLLFFFLFLILTGVWNELDGSVSIISISIQHLHPQFPNLLDMHVHPMNQYSQSISPLLLLQGCLCLPGRENLRMISGGALIIASTLRAGSQTWYLVASNADTTNILNSFFFFSMTNSTRTRPCCVFIYTHKRTSLVAR